MVDSRYINEHSPHGYLSSTHCTRPVPKRGKRKLGDDDEPQDPEAEADEECDLTFTTLARRLVDMAAAAANANNDDNYDAHCGHTSG